MSAEMRDPLIAEWLRNQHSELPSGALPALDQLTALLTAAQPSGTQVPEDVLTAWARTVVHHRRVVDQSEPAFIREARKRGWTWERIAEALGLADAHAAEQRSEILAAELRRTHPANNPVPYTQGLAERDETPRS